MGKSCTAESWGVRISVGPKTEAKEARTRLINLVVSDLMEYLVALSVLVSILFGEYFSNSEATVSNEGKGQTRGGSPGFAA